MLIKTEHLVFKIVIECRLLCLILFIFAPFLVVISLPYPLKKLYDLV